MSSIYYLLNCVCGFFILCQINSQLFVEHHICTDACCHGDQITCPGSMLTFSSNVSLMWKFTIAKLVDNFICQFSLDPFFPPNVNSQALSLFIFTLFCLYLIWLFGLVTIITFGVFSIKYKGHYVYFYMTIFILFNFV